MTTHTCPTCGRALRAPVTEDHSLLSLPEATMRDLTVYPCSGCGDSVVTIPDPDGMNRAVVRQIAKRPGRMTGGEIRFIRKAMGYDVHTFATALGVTTAQIKLYESDRARVGPTVDRLIRVLAVVFSSPKGEDTDPIQDDIVEIATSIGAAVDAEARDMRYYVRYRMSANGWVQASAP